MVLEPELEPEFTAGCWSEVTYKLELLVQLGILSPPGGSGSGAGAGTGPNSPPGAARSTYEPAPGAGPELTTWSCWSGAGPNSPPGAGLPVHPGAGPNSPRRCWPTWEFTTRRWSKLTTRSWSKFTTRAAGPPGNSPPGLVQIHHPELLVHQGTQPPGAGPNSPPGAAGPPGNSPPGNGVGAGAGAGAVPGA